MGVWIKVASLWCPIILLIVYWLIPAFWGRLFGQVTVNLSPTDSAAVHACGMPIRDIEVSISKLTLQDFWSNYRRYSGSVTGLYMSFDEPNSEPERITACILEIRRSKTLVKFFKLWATSFPGRNSYLWKIVAHGEILAYQKPGEKPVCAGCRKR